MDPLTLAAVKIGEIIVRNPNVQGVLTDAARQFWALLTQERPPAPTMNELLAQQRALAVKMAKPTFHLDFVDHMDYYGLLLMVTTLVTYIKRHGCLYQDFYSGEDYVYFPPPVEAPSLGAFEETGRVIIAGGQEYHFYLLIKHPSIDKLRAELNPIAIAQEEPDSFLIMLEELNAPAIAQEGPEFLRRLEELKALFGISIDEHGTHQFRVSNLPREGINMRFDPRTPERISHDLLNLIDQDGQLEAE